LDRANSYVKNGFCKQERISSVLLLLALSDEEGRKRGYELTKRLFDLMVASVLLVALAPLLALIGLVLALDEGVILYSQPRLGRGMMPFWVLKFRTLKPDADSRLNSTPLEKSNSSGQSTRFGAILRKYKFDELPQLINVFKGEMSLVGPRPLPVDESLVTHDRRMLRFAVRPGMTGLWQANRSNLISGRRRLALDFHYVRIRSWPLDVMILLKTIAVVFRGEEEMPRALAGSIRSGKKHDSANDSSHAA